MCGIIGIVGKSEVGSALYDALTVDAGTNTGDSLSETDAITLRNADPATSTTASCT